MPVRMVFDRPPGRYGGYCPALVRCQVCFVVVRGDKLHGEPEHMPVEKYPLTEPPPREPEPPEKAAEEMRQAWAALLRKPDR